MRKALFSVVIIATFSCSVFAQDGAKKPQLFQYVEQMPEPMYNLNQYIAEHLTYPEDARQRNIEGRVIVKFVVDETGRIDSVKILKSVYPSLDNAAVAVVSGMPNWTPGKQNGKAVKVYYTIPLAFKLDNKPAVIKDTSAVYTQAEHMPVPTADIAVFLSKNIDYPTDAKEAGIQGTITVKYVVDTKGVVSLPTIENSLYPSLDSEALRVVTLLPYFIPGSQGGKPVKIYCTSQVVFNIKGDSIQKAIDPVFTTADDLPFADYNLIKFIQLSKAYPAEDRDAKREGEVIVGFTVNEDGEISHVTKLLSTGTSAMNAEAMQVVMSMPRWNPGKIKGRPVKVYAMQRISFKLRKAVQNRSKYSLY